MFNNQFKNSILMFLILGAFFLLSFFTGFQLAIPHIFVEIISAIFAISIFIIGFNTSEYSKNNLILVISSGYLIVGLLTVFHALTYDGVLLLRPTGMNVSTQFSLSSRLIETLTLCIGFLTFKSKHELNVYRFLPFVFINVGLIVLSIMYGFFPTCFIDGVGYTLFKVIAEYIIWFLFIVDGYFLWEKRYYFENDIFKPLFLAVLAKILAQFCFVFWDETQSFIVLGHFFLLISFLYIYIALIRGSLTKPYKVLFSHVTNYAHELSQKITELRIKDKVIASAQSAFVLVDFFGKIIYVNPSYIKLLSYDSDEEVIGRSVSDFVLFTERLNAIHDELFEKDLYTGELLVRKKDGTYLQCSLIANFVHSTNGVRECVMAVFSDNSERKKTELELINAKKAAEAASVTKSTFLANMSHEIRTPMNGIMGFLQLLEQSELENKQKEYIKNIKISTESLLTLINDILDVSKIEAGKMELEMISFDLHEVIRKSIIPFTTKAIEKGIQLNINVMDDVPQYVMGDPTRLRQILINLVSNAFKFTQNGEVEIKIQKKKQSCENSELEFSVRDTGIGMSDETLSKIFNPFTQADFTSTRKYGGTGLGLNICKSIIEMMGGDIIVESEEGVGSKFIFSVLLKEGKVNDLSLTKQIMNASILDSFHSNEQKINVLLVEDNEINRILMMMMMNMKNIECDIATNGHEAIEKWEQHSYDLIFMDCQMPVMDGYQATIKIRELENKEQHTNIVAMTANAMKGDAEKCIQSGMDDYLCKPINLNQVMMMISKYTSTDLNYDELMSLYESVLTN